MFSHCSYFGESHSVEKNRKWPSMLVKRFVSAENRRFEILGLKKI